MSRRFQSASPDVIRSAYSPNPQAYGAASPSEKDSLAAREKVFKAAGASSTSYALISPSQSIPDSALSGSAKLLKLAGNLVYSFDFRLHPTAPQSLLMSDTDAWMYDFYTGARSPSTVLNAVKDKFLSTGGTPGNNAIRDEYIDMIKEVTERLKTSSSGMVAEALLGKTWNDGKYTYKIDNSGVVTTGGKTFSPSDSNYAAVANNLNADYTAGKLKSGSAPSYTPKQSSYTPSYQPPTLPTVPAKPVGILDAWWFWPAVGAGTLATAVGSYFLFFRKKEE